MENTETTNSDSLAGQFMMRPRPAEYTKVSSTPAVMTTIPGQPSPTIPAHDNWKPYRTMYSRSTGFAAMAKPGFNDQGTGAMLRHSTPARIATSKAETPGRRGASSAAMPHEIPAPANATAKPGRIFNMYGSLADQAYSQIGQS